MLVAFKHVRSFIRRSSRLNLSKRNVQHYTLNVKHILFAASLRDGVWSCYISCFTVPKTAFNENEKDDCLPSTILHSAWARFDRNPSAYRAACDGRTVRPPSARAWRSIIFMKLMTAIPPQPRRSHGFMPRPSSSLGAANKNRLTRRTSSTYHRRRARRHHCWSDAWFVSKNFPPPPSLPAISARFNHEPQTER